MVQLITIYSGIEFEDVGVNRISAFLDQNKIENVVIHIEQHLATEEQYAQLLPADYYGFSVYGSNIEDAARLSKMIKRLRPSAIVFWGSQYVSLAYEEILEKYGDIIDVTVLGDGEYPILEMVNRNFNLDNSALRGYPFVASKTDQIQKEPCLIDIQKLPWPKHELAIMRRHLYTTIKTSNGCMGDCAFCGFLRRKWTGYTGEQIYNEIIRIEKEYGIRSFMIADNSFEDPGLIGKKRIADFLDYLQHGNVRFSFFANIRAESFGDNYSDVLLLKRMKQCGFSQLFVGIESGNDDDLQLYNKKATVNDNYSILRLLNTVGIEAKWGFIMLNPYSNPQKLKQNYEFLVKNHSYDPFHFMSYLMIYINSKLYQKTIDDGLLIDSFDKTEANYRFVDPFAQAVYRFFLNKYNNTELQFKCKQFKDNLLLYHHLSQIAGVSFPEEVMTVKKRLAFLNKDFFGIIYEKQDFSLAERAYAEYGKEMMATCDDFVSVKNRMLRKYAMFIKAAKESV